MDDYCLKCNTNFSPSDFYVICKECYPVRVALCLLCFARGATFLRHKSHHAYEIMRLDFPVLRSDWTAAEEFDLLQGLQAHGYGNWQDVSVAVKSKTAEECEEHFETSYGNQLQTRLDPRDAVTFNGNADESLSSISCDDQGVNGLLSNVEQLCSFNPARDEYMFVWNSSADVMISKLQIEETSDVTGRVTSDVTRRVDSGVEAGSPACSESDDSDSSSHTVAYSDETLDALGPVETSTTSTAGRESQHSGHAVGPQSLCPSTPQPTQVAVNDDNEDRWGDEDEELYCATKMTIPSIYNHVLVQRQIREAIVKQLKLWDGRKIREHRKLIEADAVRGINEHLLPLLRHLADGEDEIFVKQLEDLSRLRSEINRLKRARRLGVRHSAGCVLEQTLLVRRERRLPRVGRLLHQAINKILRMTEDSKKLFAESAMSNILIDTHITRGLAVKKETPRLEVRRLPGYEKLTEDEIELCSSARFQPDDFIRYKEQLISESQTSGGIRLAHARTLLRIDVNKTRRVFNFLAQHNLITVRDHRPSKINV